MKNSLPSEVLSYPLVSPEGNPATLEDALNEINEPLEDVLYKFSMSGNLKKFLAWTENSVIVLVHTGFMSYLDVLPRHPVKKD